VLKIDLTERYNMKTNEALKIVGGLASLLRCLVGPMVYPQQNARLAEF
jgi:hypothetical protein